MDSYPLYRETQRIIDTEGCGEKFKKKHRVLGASGGRRDAAST